MTTETSKLSTLTSWPVTRPSKAKLLDLQRRYMKRYGATISQDKVAAILLEKATINDLPSPTEMEAKAA